MKGSRSSILAAASAWLLVSAVLAIALVATIVVVPTPAAGSSYVYDGSAAYAIGLAPVGDVTRADLGQHRVSAASQPAGWVYVDRSNLPLTSARRGAGLLAPRVTPSTDLVPYDPQWASRQLLGQNLPGSSGYAVTPAGRTVSAHGAERIALGGGGRPGGVPLEYVDEILDTGSSLRYDPFRQSIQVRAPQLPGRPYVVVDSQTGQHIVTAMVPKL